jgi:hypothetical protein
MIEAAQRWLDLAELAERLDPQLEPMARAVRAFVRGDQDAFGIKPHVGQRKAGAQLAKAERDWLIRAAAARFYPGQNDARQADQLSQQMSRYFSSGWQNERGELECPQRRRGRITGAIWEMFQLVPLPLKKETVREILGAS